MATVNTQSLSPKKRNKILMEGLCGKCFKLRILAQEVGESVAWASYRFN